MKYTKETTCRKSALRSIRHFVKQKLMMAGMDDNSTALLTLAVDEVCANMIIHSNKCDPRNFIRIELQLSPGAIEFLISDGLPIFDIPNYRVPQLGELIKEKKPGGIGLILVKKIMDEIELQTTKNGGHVCRMAKYLPLELPHPLKTSHPTESHIQGPGV